MNGNIKFLISVALSKLLLSPAFAAADTLLSAADRDAVVRTLTTEINANYITPAVAKRVGDAVAVKNAAGGYASAAGAQAFSAALAKDLREMSGDLHFNARFDDRVNERGRNDDALRRADIENEALQTVRSGYGIEKIEHLPGNVAYLELRDFGPTELVGPAYTAAMSLVVGADALILDLRRNKGGFPASVAQWMSHFFPLGERRHLNDIYNRPENTTRESWTVTDVAQRYAKPVYVLTSAITGSGGEECAYDFQTQKRATLVGETTVGAANPVRLFSMGHGIMVAIPVGRSINPITKTSWEHVGVKPDIPVPAAHALQAAHVAILRSLVAAEKDAAERANLQRLLTMEEKGENETPVYTRTR